MRKRLRKKIEKANSINRGKLWLLSRLELDVYQLTANIEVTRNIIRGNFTMTHAEKTAKELELAGIWLVRITEIVNNFNRASKQNRKKKKCAQSTISRL